MSATDRYADWDAAYILGALSPAERNEFETHLASCPDCRAAVGDLAGMPGLLAQVPPAEAWAIANEMADEGAAVTSIAPRRAAPRWWQVAVAAVLVAVLGGVGGYGVRALSERATPSRLAFATVTPSAMTAVVDLVPVAGGTEVKVECQYGEGSWGEDTYSIWVVDRAGRGTEIKPWTVKPNKVMHPSGVSELPLNRIGAVEIRSGDVGPVVLRAVV